MEIVVGGANQDEAPIGSSKVPPMDMDPPCHCPRTPTMTYSSMPVLGMTKPKRLI